jgi:predicted transcriptional regulator
LNKPDDTKDPIKKLTTAQEQIKDRTDKITKAKEDLKTTADNVYKAAEGTAKELPKQIEKLIAIAKDAKAADLLENLPAQFPSLNNNINLQLRFAVQWPLLDTELKKLTSTSTKPAEAIKASFDITGAH